MTANSTDPNVNSDSPLLSAVNLHRVSSQATLLDSVTCELRAGDRVLLQGDSGSGKSLLLRSLVLLEPVSGEVRWKGQELMPAQIPKFRAECVYVQQRPALGQGAEAKVSSRSATDPSDSAPSKSAPSKSAKSKSAKSKSARSGAVKLGTVEAVLREPFGWGVHRDKQFEISRAHEVLGQLGLPSEKLAAPADRLSGGEQEMIAFARVLLLDPSVLLLDEPTSGLDAESADRLFDSVIAWQQSRSDRAWIWVAHHGALIAKVATQRWRMAAGRLDTAGVSDDVNQ